jgi:hypothetical protein
MNCKCQCWARVVTLTGNLRLANNWKAEGHPNKFPPLTSCHTENALHLYYKAIFIAVYSECYTKPAGTRWRSWLRHCASSRKVEGSIPDGFFEIFR